MKPDKYTVEVNVDTEQPTKALDMLQDRIRSSQNNLEAFHAAVVGLARKTPWYRRLTLIQCGQVTILLVHLVLNVAILRLLLRH